MKIIHCADIHLDSAMRTHLDRESAALRRAELIDTFLRMADYAVDNGCDAIIIAGDLFDTDNISATARNTVLHCIEAHSDITFFYLRGNHDNGSFWKNKEDIPHNLKLFSDRWTSYELVPGKTDLWGIELSAGNIRETYGSLTTDPGKYNIVTLHGQEAETGSHDGAPVINLRNLRNKGIDYLALGHVHAYKMGRLDARGVYCYPGCLEGRGFDECGEHGFVVLTIDEDTHHADARFVPFAKRKLYEIHVDVTGLNSTAAMINAAEEAVIRTGCIEKDLIKIVLCGSVDIACEKDILYIEMYFKDRYFFAKVCDATGLSVDFYDYRLDESLKGEFVRRVMADETMSDDDKKAVIRYGIRALAGEELD